jgi:hypothetical protein
MSTVKTKHLCEKCGYEFSARGGNYQKHVAKCDGSYKPYTKSTCCKYCDQSFDNMSVSEIANHTRWCELNPKKSYYTANTAKMRQGITEQSRKKQAEGIKQAWVDGKYIHVDHRTFLGRTHTQETKELQRKKALASPHRRLRKGVVEYRGVLLDSSWELALAKRLDELEIKWIRPDPIPWTDSHGVVHNYFPDFYLPDHDLFLDPKNPQAIKVQQQKLDCILTQYQNIVIINTLEKCKNFNFMI